MTTNFRALSPLSLRLAVGAFAISAAWLAGPVSATAAEKGSEQVSPFAGSFSQAISIEVPGFRGLEPRLALAYSSEGRNGFVGVGWQVAGFGQIERVNATRGTTIFEANDVYLLDGQEMFACPVGSLSPSCTSGGTHAFKVETYIKVNFDQGANTWTVRRRDGTRAIYTPLLQASAGTLRWGLSSVVDMKGNTVSYAWACVDGDCYPSTVSYNGYSITFYRETRPTEDILTFPAYDTVNETKYRLRSVIVSLGATAIRGYKLAYKAGGSPLTKRSLLESVTRYGRDLVQDGQGLITGGSALPPQSFTYQEDPAGQAGATFVTQTATPPTPSGTTEPVRWTQRVSAYSWGTGNSLYKESGGSAWNAGAVSTRAITSGDGYVEFTTRWDGQNKLAMAGLSAGNTDATYQDVDFAFYETAGAVAIYEAGVAIPGSWAVVEGDRLRVEVQGGVVYYKRNGATLYTSSRAPVYPLLVDTSIRIVGNVIHDVSISGALQDGYQWCSGEQLLTGDVNADGRTDQLCHRATGEPGGRMEVALATASGFGAPSTWYSGYYFNQTMVADMNQDGRADLVDYVNWDGTFFVALANDTGTAFLPKALWGTAVGIEYDGNLYACKVQSATVGLGDFNGDGTTDVSCKINGQSETFVGLSNGSSAFTFGIWGRLSSEFLERNGSIDFNGDGKGDWYTIGMTTHVLRVYTSNGFGFGTSYFGTLDSNFCTEPNYLFGDVNGDGRTDAVCKENGKVALSSGREFIVRGSWGGWCAAPGKLFAGDADGDGASELICHHANGEMQVRKWLGNALSASTPWKAAWCATSVLAGDFDGDGKTDLLCDSQAVGVAVAGTPGRIVDLVTTATNGIGGTVTAAYGPGTAWLETNTPKQVLTSITRNDGRATPTSVSTTTYSYRRGKMDAKERRFLGFWIMRETQPCLTGETTCPYTRTILRQDSLATAGQVEEIQRWTDDSYPSSVVHLDYTLGSTYGTVSALQTGETHFTYLDTTTAGCTTWPCNDGKRKYLVHTYDAYGNRTQTVNHGDYDAAGDETTTKWSFYPNTSSYIVDRLAREQVYQGTSTAGALLRDSAFRYDLNATALTQPTQGYLTMSLRWLISGGRWVSRSYGRDGWGNMTSLTDETSRTTELTFDPTYHVFPASMRNLALPSELETATWNALCGSIAQHVDVNLQATIATEPDAFCRPTRTDFPGGQFESRSYLSLGNPALQRVRVQTRSASEQDGTGDYFSEQFFDGMGRVWQQARKGAATGQVIVEKTEYDVRGNAFARTAPFHATGPAPYAASETWYTTNVTFDGLDRVVGVQYPDQNGTTTQYGLLSQTFVDEHLHQKTVRFDVSGRKVKDEGLDSGQTVATTYQHDLLGRLTGITDNRQNLWAWTFDSLGRTTARTDPDSGSWTFGYDDADRLGTHTDAKQQRTDFGFDAAGRPSTKSTYLASGPLEQTVTTTYGQARAGYFNVGRPTTIAGPGSTTVTMDYDVAGRNVKSVRVLDGVSYELLHRYKTSGHLKSVRYPAGEILISALSQFAYDPAGRLSGAPGLIASVTYDAAGRPLVQTNGNGTVTTRTYSPQRGFLTGLRTMAGATTVQDLVYTPDEAGLVEAVTSPFGREGWTYGYDDMHRLTAATSASHADLNQTFTYDDIGRMTDNSRFGTYTYPLQGSVRPHAPTAVPTRGTLDYDANGNLQSNGGVSPRIISWNVANLPTQIQPTGGTATQFTYGGLGERLKKVTGASTSLYPVGDNYEVTNGVQTRYLSLPGLGLVAKRIGGTENERFWIHTDRLGSVQAVTDASGVEVQRRSYRPYGDKVQDSTAHAESRGYIDQRQDGETGLTYLHARYNDPDLGIFLSPDPLHPSLPGVGLNRYSYGFGDPVNGTDRSGLVVECPLPSDAPMLCTGYTETVDLSDGPDGFEMPGSGYTQLPGSGQNGPATPNQPKTPNQPQPKTGEESSTPVGCLSDDCPTNTPVETIDIEDTNGDGTISADEAHTQMWNNFVATTCAPYANTNPRYYHLPTSTYVWYGVSTSAFAFSVLGFPGAPWGSAFNWTAWGVDNAVSVGSHFYEPDRNVTYSRPEGPVCGQADHR